MKKLQLVLTNPCIQNWEQMSPVNDGRYCDSCKKKVVDLTLKSDAEVIAFFKKKKSNVCGRLLSTQLHRELAVPPQKNSWYWLLPIAFGMSVFTSAKASELKPVVIHNDMEFSPFQKSKQLNQNSKTTDTIRGKVIDQATGSPLAGVKVVQNGFKNVMALTDSAGNFMLTIKIEERVNPLVFSLPDYGDITQSISTYMEVKLPKIVRIILGGVHTITTDNQPLYVVYSGDKHYFVGKGDHLKGINPEWVEKIEVLKGTKATAIYGIKGANGVILIGIKEKFADKIDTLKE